MKKERDMNISDLYLVERGKKKCSLKDLHILVK